MDKSIEAMKLALEVLEKNTKHLPADFDYHFDAITAIKEALAQTQEPVCPDCKAKVLYECVACSSNNYPPQRTWVGLTADEIWDEWLEQSKPERNTHNFVVAFTRAIEAKLKEKNT